MTMSSTLLLFLLLVVGLLAGIASAVSDSIYLNCGGPMLYRDSAGNVWTGDDFPSGNFSYYNSGRNHSTDANVTGTDDPSLYQTERWDHKKGVEMSYEIPVANGTYDVLLHFAEIWSKGQEPNARKFNVWIEKMLVLEEFDMFALYGGFTAIIESFTTTVDDGALTIDFVRGSENNPKISAIEVHPAAPSSAPSVSKAPSESPAPTISTAPSSSPTISAQPTPRPSLRPTKRPTPAPVTPTTTEEPDTPETTETQDTATTLEEEPETTAAAKEPDATSAAAVVDTTEPQDVATTADPDTTAAAAVKPTTASPKTDPPGAMEPETMEPGAAEWKRVDGGAIDWMKPENNTFDGNVLDLSGDGKVVAIGQTQSDTTDDFSGRVAIFKHNDFFGWTPFGDDIDLGDDPDGALFGYSVSLNEDGKVIAIGDPGDSLSRSKGRAFIYECKDLKWQLKGQVISPIDEGEQEVYAGRTVSLSADGDTVAVVMQIKGRIPGPPTFVRVFRYSDSKEEWKQLGQEIFGRLATVNDPFSIDLCKDGTTVAISSLVPGTGYVEMYEYKGKTNGWERMGDAITATEEGIMDDAVGITVTMSTNGKVVAFGARIFNSPNIVRVYEYVNDNWKPIGTGINSGGAVNARRLSLSISGDGTRVAVGPQDETAFSSVYGWDGSTWSQIGGNLDSIELQKAGLQLQTIAMSEDGERVAVFSPGGGREIAVYDEVLSVSQAL